MIAQTANALRKMVRSCTFLAVKHFFEVINPSISGNCTEYFFRKLGFCHTPSPAEVVAQYLRGYVLFGRAASNQPWFQWHYVPTRAVIFSETANIPRRLRPLLNRTELKIKYDADVGAIIRFSQQGRQGWLTPEVVNFYLMMDSIGLIGSVGTYHNERLVGGLWGLALGRVFAIMSMFHHENHAGALALAALTQFVANRERWEIIDCGAPSQNWQRYGAQVIGTPEFSNLVTRALFGKASSPDKHRYLRS